MWLTLCFACRRSQIQLLASLDRAETHSTPWELILLSITYTDQDRLILSSLELQKNRFLQNVTYLSGRNICLAVCWGLLVTPLQPHLVQLLLPTLDLLVNSLLDMFDLQEAKERDPSKTAMYFVPMRHLLEQRRNSLPLLVQKLRYFQELYEHIHSPPISYSVPEWNTKEHCTEELQVCHFGRTSLSVVQVSCCCSLQAHREIWVEIHPQSQNLLDVQQLVTIHSGGPSEEQGEEMSSFKVTNKYIKCGDSCDCWS